MQGLRVAKEGARPRRSGAYIGFAGYATILACLKQPRTDVEVADITGIWQGGVRSLLKQFHALRLIHRVGWVRPSGRGFDKPVYLLGRGDDVPAKLTQAGGAMPFADFKPRLQERVITFASLVHALEHPITLADLAAQSGVYGSRLSEITRHMMSAPVRLIFICGYETVTLKGGGTARILQYGPDRRDVRKPPTACRITRERRRRDIRRPQWDQLVMSLKRGAGFEIARP